MIKCYDHRIPTNTYKFKFQSSCPNHFFMRYFDNFTQSIYFGKYDGKMKLAKLIKPVELDDIHNSLYHLNFPHVSDILKPLDLTSEIMNNIQNHEDHLMAREKNEESEQIKPESGDEALIKTIDK